MRVGAYVDGLNLYYGGRHLCGRSTPGWRWLDVPKLVELLVSRNRAWIAQQAVIHRIAYCSAMIDGVSGHWWYSLTADDFFSCQLSDAVGEHRKPAGW